LARPYCLHLDPALSPSPSRPALIWAEGLDSNTDNNPMAAQLDAAIREATDAEGATGPSEVYRHVRDMLRHGHYKPAGRGKPASEFLRQAAHSGAFPRVNCPVDVNNWISLVSGLPGSIFDAVKTGEELFLRHGLADECYVFNASGQSIDLEDLLVVCRRVGDRWEPCGNPVKDAMATKVGPATRDVLAVLYAPASMSLEQVELWARRYAHGLSAHCSAYKAGYRVVDIGTR